MSPVYGKRRSVIILSNMLIIFMLSGLALAKTQDSRQAELADNIIGSTFKTLAKGFIATVDIDKLKKNNIEKLKKMNEEKFRGRYVKIFNILKDSPYFTVQYGFTENMSRNEAIEKIGSLNKKKSYEMIDAIPNTLIAKQFRQYLSEKKQEIQKSNVAVQIHQLWDRIIKKAYANKHK